MANIFEKIFGLKGGQIPTVRAPAGYPESCLPVRPKVRGLSPEDRQNALTEYHLRMRAHWAEIAKFQRERREQMGLSAYKWVAIPGACCAIGAANDGKAFSSEKPPREGHPAEGACSSKDWCRCHAKAIVPGFG